MTNGYVPGDAKRTHWSRRVLVPLLFVTTTAIVGGCLRQGGANDSATPGGPRGAAPTPTPTPAPLGSLSQDDPRLGMKALTGQSLISVLSSSVQVLPGGNVPTDPSAAVGSAHLSPTTITRWVQNSADTTLWSGPDSTASAFNDVPANSYFRATGPQSGDRLPVYYVGDGLFLMPGDGWVDASAVNTVDAPAPGQVPAVDADANASMPGWVEAHRATKLWSGPDDNGVTLTDLPQWTFLKVAGPERNGRLLVNYAGDYASRQPGIGWVDQGSVGPAGDPGVWVTNHRATPLWSGVDDSAVKFTDLPQWTKLRIIQDAPADPTRMEVQYFGDGFTRQPGIAWVTLADIGPITPPNPLPALPIAGSQVQHQAFASGNDFIAVVGSAAQVSARTTGVPASVTVAQAILESDWGRSRLTREGNNLFGIKAIGGPGPDGVVTLATWEHLASGDVVVQAPFKAYYTLEQSITDHGSFFTSNHRYASALSVARDARAFAQAIQDAGYATDPNYANKLIGLMDKYNLYRFDS